MKNPNDLLWGVRWRPPLPNTPELQGPKTMDGVLVQRLADAAKIWVGADGARVERVPEGDPALWAHEWIAYREAYAQWEKATDLRHLTATNALEKPIAGATVDDLTSMVGDAFGPFRHPRPTCPEVRQVSILEKELAWKMQEFLRRVIDVPVQAADEMLGKPTEAITRMLLEEPRPVYVPKPRPRVAKPAPRFKWDGIRKSVHKQLAIKAITRWKNKELNVGLTSHEEREMDAFVRRLDNPREEAIAANVGQPQPGWWLDFEDFWDEALSAGVRVWPPRSSTWEAMLDGIAVRYYSEQAQKRATKHR